MIILGIETTCDETAAAVVNDQRQILSSVMASQITTHQIYGGVVPEIAARAHLDKIEDIVRQAMQSSQLEFNNLSGVAVTAGPGLIGGVHIGVIVAKIIAAVHKLPFLAVNHLAAHALTARLTHDVEFPYLLLLVSGGHTQLLICYSVKKFQLLGSTLDDALGETFDKCARMMNLSYPGGPKIEALAKHGDSGRFQFPLPLIHKNNHNHSKFNFSFSGLKTAVRMAIQNAGDMDQQMTADIAASFQHTVQRILADRCGHALQYCQDHGIGITALVIAGGVAANQQIHHSLQQVSQNFSVPCVAPPIHLCTDNAAMVAWTGIEKLQSGLIDQLDFIPRPRWLLTEI